MALSLTTTSSGVLNLRFKTHKVLTPLMTINEHELAKALSIERFRLVSRIDKEKNLIHYELFDKKRPFLNLILMIPYMIRKFIIKPACKCGMKCTTFPATASLVKVIKESCNIEKNDRNITMISLMIYMYVSEKYRKQNIGSTLLDILISKSIELHANYLLLVVDDNGTGKLFDYYKNKGFIEIFNYIDRGMILNLKNC